MLTIITHTRGTRAPWFDECVASVKKFLPDNAVHQIEVLGELSNEDYLLKRWDSIPDSGYFCFVDDDDVIVNDSLRLCVEALESTGAGCAFTAQSIINHDGSVVNPPSGSSVKSDGSLYIQPVRYFESTVHPQVIHHLCVMRRDAIDTKLCKEMTNRYGVGGEWIMKSSAALIHGAIQVPIVGYYWRHHNNNQSRNPEFKDGFVKKIGLLGRDLARLQQHQGFIPQYTRNLNGVN